MSYHYRTPQMPLSSESTQRCNWRQLQYHKGSTSSPWTWPRSQLKWDMNTESSESTWHEGRTPTIRMAIRIRQNAANTAFNTRPNIYLLNPQNEQTSLQKGTGYNSCLKVKEAFGYFSWINTFKSSYVLMATGSIHVFTRIVSFSFVCSFSGTRSRTKSHSNHHDFTSFHHSEFLIVLSHDKNQTYFGFQPSFSNCYCRYVWLILLM